ncbi:putative Fanconi anemia group J protein-like [Apostichopus japonicus]|uniref:Putative Fanconi anemia group J protein-like n=1 Tax=Stichopus japonicus TaxID=307972 RepID=A0A2G8KDS8_STIJA|nr:putative Fanconi anemia group J protein-like [Apostichopus japonicus]
MLLKPVLLEWVTISIVHVVNTCTLEWVTISIVHVVNTCTLEWVTISIVHVVNTCTLEWVTISIVHVVNTCTLEWVTISIVHVVNTCTLEWVTISIVHVVNSCTLEWVTISIVHVVKTFTLERERLGALILVDERFRRNPQKYISGLSKWVRHKVNHFLHSRDGVDSLKNFVTRQQKNSEHSDSQRTSPAGSQTFHDLSSTPLPSSEGTSCSSHPATPTTPRHLVSTPLQFNKFAKPTAVMHGFHAISLKESRFDKSSPQSTNRFQTPTGRKPNSYTSHCVSEEKLPATTSQTLAHTPSRSVNSVSPTMCLDSEITPLKNGPYYHCADTSEDSAEVDDTTTVNYLSVKEVEIELLDQETQIVVENEEDTSLLHEEESSQETLKLNEEVTVDKNDNSIHDTPSSVTKKQASKLNNGSVRRSTRSKLRRRSTSSKKEQTPLRKRTCCHDDEETEEQEDTLLRKSKRSKKDSSLTVKERMDLVSGINQL